MPASSLSAGPPGLGRLRPLRVLVRGCGDVGSAVAHRQASGGDVVVVHDMPSPAAARRGMAFADAMFDGCCELEGLVAYRLDDLSSPPWHGTAPAVALTARPFTQVLRDFRPEVLVDARMRKRAVPEDQRGLAGFTVGLGPGFIAGQTCDVAVETQWGDQLGTVIRRGKTRDLAGEPRSLDGHARDRFVYAPAAGLFRTRAGIGERVRQGDPLATIGETLLRAPLDGILRGLTHDNVLVDEGSKVIEIDPRGDVNSTRGIGERPRRISTGAAAAIDEYRSTMSPARTVSSL